MGSSAPVDRDLSPPLLRELVQLLGFQPEHAAIGGFSEPASASAFHGLHEGEDASDFEAIFFLLEDPFRIDLGALVRRLRNRLEVKGCLIIAFPDPVAGTIPEQRGLPTNAQTGTRALVRCLSNCGFSIRRDKPSTEPGWRLILAQKDPFVVRSYRAGDESAILSLFPNCFHTVRSPEHWRWKFTASPYGNTHISQAFDSEGQLAAHYAGYPVPYWFASSGEKPRRFLALQMGDTMTDPRFRASGRGRQSLLARTVRHFFAVNRDDSFGFFYGFNTGPIQRFCNWFIGGSRVEPVGFWCRDNKPRGPHQGYRVENVQRVPSNWDPFFHRVAPRYGFLVERDARYLDWRYFGCPDPGLVTLVARKWGRLVGWSVFRRREDRLIWGDALFDPRHALAAGSVLAAALEAPEFRGVAKIEAWFSERPIWWRETLPKIGFERAAEPNGLVLMALPETETLAVRQLQQLYYTMGDGDLF